MDVDGHLDREKEDWKQILDIFVSFLKDLDDDNIVYIYILVLSDQKNHE